MKKAIEHVFYFFECLCMWMAGALLVLVLIALIEDMRLLMLSSGLFCMLSALAFVSMRGYRLFKLKD